MSYPLPLTRTEAYLAYKAGVIQQSELKPSLSVPRIGIDDWLAYWTGLKNDYPKNPDGTPKMLQEEEKYIAYLCGVTDTYPENCYRRVGAYLRYIISARWGRPDHPLNREELYLSLIKTQFIPSGDPSSDIVIDGTTKAPFVDVKLYGDTFQQSYTGKNLYNVEAIPYIAKRAYGSNGSVLSWTDYAGTNEYQPVEPNTEYTLWNNKIGNTTYLCEYDENKNFIQRLVATRTFTTTAATKYLRWSLNVGSGEVPPTQTQLELGSTATSYEQFVGGRPSPNPDYPQPIQTVTGTQTVEVQGKNLFDKSSQSILRNKRVSTSNGGTYDVGGWSISPRIKVIPGETYTVGGVGQTSYYCWYKDGVYISGSGVTANGHITAPSGANQIKFDYPTANEAQIQFEIGSTVTDYAPYSKQTYTIDLGDIELNNLDDTHVDYIWEDGEDWKIRKNTSRFTFETRKLMGLSKQNLGFVYNTDNNPLVGKHIPLAGKCSHFDVETTDTTWTGINRTGMNSGGALWFMTTNTNQGDTRTIEEFGQWLVDAGVSFVYALETPTDTVITNQALIDQLNALKQGGAEEGTTYIKVSSADPNLPGLLYVEAPKYE